METAARFAPRPSDKAAEHVPLPTPERALAVTATYLLSEEGRKASLLAGGDGRAVQQVSFTVPATRLHLVTVDGNGIARLKLRPRFELDGSQRVIRKDHLPTYDVPTLDELFREAARNHQLERAYHAERTAERAKRREIEHELRAQVARAFLADPSGRALERPTPTRQYCFLVTDRGRDLRFDVSLDEGVARDVPPEAYRRYKSDVRARNADGRQERATQLSVHDQKIAFVADWVAKHGTLDQKAAVLAIVCAYGLYPAFRRAAGPGRQRTGTFAARLEGFFTTRHPRIALGGAGRGTRVSAVCSRREYRSQSPLVFLLRAHSHWNRGF